MISDGLQDTFCQLPKEILRRETCLHGIAFDTLEADVHRNPVWQLTGDFQAAEHRRFAGAAIAFEQNHSWGTVRMQQSVDPSPPVLPSVEDAFLPNSMAGDVRIAPN